MSLGNTHGGFEFLIHFNILFVSFKKISKKRVLKYKQEYSIMKEEQELKEDPIERLKVRFYVLLLLYFLCNESHTYTCFHGKS